MQDRPEAVNLLETMQELLMKDIMPKVKSDEFLAYKTLVSWNMLGVIAREMKLGENYLNQEIIRLSELFDETTPDLTKTYLEKMKISEELNKKLVSEIRKNEFDNTKESIWNLVKQNLKEKLEITNPRFSLD